MTWITGIIKNEINLRRRMKKIIRNIRKNKKRLIKKRTLSLGSSIDFKSALDEFKFKSSALSIITIFKSFL